MLSPDEPQVKPGSRYSINDTAKHLGVCRNTVLNYINRGLLRFEYAITGRARITGAEILRFWRYNSIGER